MAERCVYMSKFLCTVGVSILPALLRLIAAAVEGYFNTLPETKDGGENE